VNGAVVNAMARLEMIDWNPKSAHEMYADTKAKKNKGNAKSAAIRGVGTQVPKTREL